MILPKGNYYVRNIENFSSSEETHILNIDNLKPNNLYNGIKWHKYRLSDTIRGKNHNDTNELHRKKWPNSICDLFKNDNSFKGKRKDKVYSIIKDKFPIKISEPYIAIHLRLGDRFGSWTKPLSYFENLDISKFNCNNIILFCGLHTGGHFQSFKFIKSVFNVLENKGANVILRCGNNPDDDFVLMCKSDHFIKSGVTNGGGYSELVCEMKRYFN